MSRQDQDQEQQAVTPPVVRLAAAEVEVAAAKDRLADTTARLQSKLDPKLIANHALGEARSAGGKGRDYARENPAVVGGVAGAILLFLLRKPLARLFKRRKGPKPQKAAKPMTATAPNERLARAPHPTHYSPAVEEPTRSAATAAHPTPHPTQASPVAQSNAAQSNEGAPIQGQNA